MTSTNEKDKENLVEKSNTLKQSPCNRYERHQKVLENSIGADITYLGMDLEEGIEVVWGESVYENISFADLDVIKNMFDRIVSLKHPNILKYHTYWVEEIKDRGFLLNYITEQFDNSLFQLIKRTKMNKKSITLRTQIRYCRQILNGLSYLHSLNPPFCFNYLQSNSVLITHDGLVKIAPIFPNKLISEIVTENGKNNVPEEGDKYVKALRKNIHDFGFIAYSLATLDYSTQNISQFPEGPASISDHLIPFEGLSSHHKDLILTCLKNPQSVSIDKLYTHQMLFEFPSLKLIAGHSIVKNNIEIEKLHIDEPSTDKIFATANSTPLKNFLISDVPSFDAKNYVNDIKSGLYPLYGIGFLDSFKKSPIDSRCLTPFVNSGAQTPAGFNSLVESKSETEENSNCWPILYDYSQVIAIQCRLERHKEVSNEDKTTSRIPLSSPLLKIVLLFYGHTSRHIETTVSFEADNAISLTEDLIRLKLIPEKLRLVLIETIDRALTTESVLVSSAYPR